MTRTPTSGVVRVLGLVGVCALAVACTKGEGGDGGVFASVGGSITTLTAGDGDTGSSGGAEEADASETGGGDTQGADTGGESGNSGVTTADATGADPTSASNTAGESSSEGGEGGGGGPACSGDGEMSFQGGGGPAAANQNCPQTDYFVQVAGAPGAIADVDVSLEAIAASTDQNRIWLISPNQVQVLLFDHGGTFLTDDFVGTIFDDQAATAVAAAPGPFHGCFRPVQGLAAFDGAIADGQWTLRVETCLYETSVTSWQLHLDF